MSINRTGIGNLYSGDVLRIEHAAGGKLKLQVIDTCIDDKDVADFCLNCTKARCSGNCADFNNFMKERRAKNGKGKILHSR